MTLDNFIDSSMDLAIAIVVDDLEPLCGDAIDVQATTVDNAASAQVQNDSPLSKYIA